MGSRCIVYGIPTLTPFQFFRRQQQKPGGMAEHAMFIIWVVHYPFSRANIVEQKSRLLEEEVVRRTVDVRGRPFRAASCARELTPSFE